MNTHNLLLAMMGMMMASMMMRMMEMPPRVRAAVHR
jgi:hypothetical protein